MTQIQGSIVALATPFHEDGSVDYPTLRQLIDWHVAEGTDCICVVGTTGESPTTSDDDHQFDFPVNGATDDRNVGVRIANR